MQGLPPEPEEIISPTPANPPSNCSPPSTLLCYGVLVLACLGALAIRAIPAYSFVFLPTRILFQETDAYYHIRHIEHLVRNFPDRFRWDPYGVFPNGQASFTGPLFDYLAATIIWITGFGAPSKQWIETVSVWMPALLGALIPIPVFFLGRALFSATAGLVAACLIAVLPGHYLRVSSLGFTDHHVLETLTSCLALYCLVRLLQSRAQRAPSAPPNVPETRQSPVRPAAPFCACSSEGESRHPWQGWTLWFGLALGAYVCTWVGGAMIVAVFAVWTFLACLVRHWQGRPTAPLCQPVAIAFLIALVLFLPALGVRWSEYTVLSLAGGAAALLALSALSTLLQNRRRARPFFYLALFGAGTLVITIAIVQWPAETQQALQQLHHLTPQGALITISELQPLLRPGLLPTAGAVWNEFTSAGFIAALALFWLVAGLRFPAPVGLPMFLFYSAFIMTTAMLQKRICYYAVIPVALLTGHACAAAMRGNRIRCLLAGLFVTFGVLAPNIVLTATKPWGGGGPSPDWIATLEWIKTKTPEPFPDPEYFLRPYPDSFRGFSYPPSFYSVMNWWDEGHWINYLARRIPVSNPHQSGAEVAARLYLARSEGEAGAIMESVRARYVLADPNLLSWIKLENGREQPHSKMQALALWAGYQKRRYNSVFLREVIEGIYEPFFVYHPDYYRTMAARLTLFNASAVTPVNSTWVITTKKHPAGRPIPVLDKLERFATYQEAVDFLAKTPDPTAQLVGLDPKSSCVPLEASPAFRIEFVSKPDRGPERMMGLKVFSYTKSVAAPEQRR